MERRDTAGLVVLMGTCAARAEAARAMARRLGVEDFLLLVRDAELSVFLPAPGFAQTLRAGAAWQSFVARCSRPGRYQGEVDLPEGQMRAATALVLEDVAAVLLGGQPVESEVEALAALLPLLGAVLCAEQRAQFASAAAEEAARAASRAKALADALEAARAEGTRLNARLRDEHRRKDDFLAMLGHELRNPLAPLVTSIELLRRGGEDERSMERHLDIMARQISQISRLVDDLLDVSRVSRGLVELRRRTVKLRDVLLDALEASRPLLDARRHRVTLSMADEDLPLHADRARLTQVFSNLLHNAAKYTEPGGHIEISTRRDGAVAAVRVTDDGIGISRDMLPCIFDLFAQAPVSLDRAQGGLGIGLTLVRALVQLHGGSVTAESAGVGRGSIFTVRLPLSAALQPGVDAGLQAPVCASPNRPMRVLIVDDNVDAADSLEALLRVLGHEVQTAYSGPQALLIAADLDADLVFLDLGLPEVDGYEVLRRLGRILRRGTRFIALTGYGAEEDRRRTREAGFDEHMVKPVLLEQLQAVLARANDDSSRAAA